MADLPSSSPSPSISNTPTNTDSNFTRPGSINPITQPDPKPDSTPPPPQSQQSLTPPPSNPNPTPNTPHAIPSLPPPPQLPAGAIPPLQPLFRPFPQFSPLPNYQNPNMGVQPPGVSAATPALASGAPGVAPAAAPGVPPAPMLHYQVLPGQLQNPALRPFAHLPPNGYAAPPVNLID